MNLLFIPAVVTTLLMSVSFAEAAPCTTSDCIAKQDSSDGIRQYGGLGTKTYKKRVFDKTTKGWFRTDWNKVMARAVKDHSCAFEKHYPTLVAKVHWSEAYIDSNRKPTRSQARDPNWSNYVWNHPENGNGFVYDGITDALNDSLIDNGRGVAKLSVRVGLTATSDNMMPPAWMRKDKSLAWVEGVNTNNKADNWHVRFDNPEAVEHAADFMAAFLAKFGNNQGIHSVNLGEYYLGQTKYRPSGLSQGKYLAGVRDLWEKVAASAPRDGNGNRVNILQTNPLFDSQVTVDDLERIGIGMSESDTRLDLPITKAKESVALKKLYDGKKVHVMVDGDSRYACQGRRQGWDGTANPFGHKKGYSGVASPQELLWYHSEKGPVPTHSFFMSIADWCTGAPQTSTNFIDAVKKFGRCGSEATLWGAAPAAGKWADLIAPGKPNPPPALVIK